MRVSFITTVFNEEKTIHDFLESILCQSKKPDEIIIVDGNSADTTVKKIRNFELKFKKIGVNFRLFVKKGNRAVGRNEAIKNARNEIIVCSDAGCVLNKNWIKNITKAFSDPKVDVVAGYYLGKANSVFEKCLIPYVLIMSDRINADNFLPASRSMAFRKSIWEKTGGFPEEFGNNEDYVFAVRLKKINAKIIFEEKALVYWLPRTNIEDAFIMFYRFAKGDAESRIFRPKVIMLFIRYIIGLLLVVSYLISKSYLILDILCLILFVYVFWSITKNYKYIKNIQAILYLPLIQLLSDIAVLLGTIKGIISFCRPRLNGRRQL